MHVIEYYFKVIWNLICNISNNGIYDQWIFYSLMFIPFYIITLLILISLNKLMVTYDLKYINVAQISILN